MIMAGVFSGVSFDEGSHFVFMRNDNMPSSRQHHQSLDLACFASIAIDQCKITSFDDGIENFYNSLYESDFGAI